LIKSIANTNIIKYILIKSIAKTNINNIIMFVFAIDFIKK